MYRKYLLAGILSCSLLACHKNDEDNTGAIITISGIYMRDINGNGAGTLGSPDVRTSLNGKSALAYPNPCNGALHLAIAQPDSGNVLIYVKAAEYAGASAADVANSDLFDKGPVYSTEHILHAGDNALQLNTASYTNGFYRLYIISGADTLWDDIQVKH